MLVERGYRREARSRPARLHACCMPSTVSRTRTPARSRIRVQTLVQARAACRDFSSGPGLTSRPACCLLPACVRAFVRACLRATVHARGETAAAWACYGLLPHHNLGRLGGG